MDKNFFKRSTRLLGVAGSLWKSEVTRMIDALANPEEGKALMKARIKQASVLASELGKLKGAAMKFGQILALEARDFFPDEVVQVLEKLQSSATPMPLAQVEHILQNELGSKYAQIQDLSIHPIAAASIGQVHTALLGEKRVAIKVQYPGVGDSLESDLNIFKTLARIVTLVSGKNEIDFAPLIAEMKEVFSEELNYLEEARKQTIFRSLASGDLRVPEVIPEFSTGKVLVQVYEEGLTVSAAVRGNHLSPAQREHYGKLFLELYTREFCEWGLVQTDPNLGNFLLQPESGRLVLLDFGAVKSYSEEFRNEYSKLVMAAFDGDFDFCKAQILKMGMLSSRESIEAQETMIQLLIGAMEPFRAANYSFADNLYATRMKELSAKLIRELKFSSPPRQIVFLHRKLGGVFQILRRLDVNLDLRPYLEPYRLRAGTPIRKGPSL